jgi:heptosyltransferase-2
MPDRKRTKILVFQTAFLGDLILTIPLIKSIKKNYNDSEIIVVVRGGLSEIIKNMEEVDGVIEYDKTGREKGILKMLRFINMLRRENFDMVFSPHRSLRTSIILFFSNIRERIGFKESALSFIYSKTVKREVALHEIEKNLLLLKAVKDDFKYEYDTCIKIKNEVYEKIKQLLAQYGVYNYNKIITVAPGSHWGTKRWLPEKFAEVISRLSADGYRVILIGSSDDSEVAGRIESNCKNVINLCGRTTIMESAALISLSDALLSNDNAAVHIASFTKTPVAVIYGPTVPSFGFTPYRVESAIIEYNGLECRPCSSHGPMKCPKSHFKCMQMISPEDVYQAVKNLVRRNVERV